MADAKAPKLIWVRPTARGQRPDGVWTDEGGKPFQVEADAVSRWWHEKVTGEEAAALDKAKAAADKAAKASDKSPDAAKIKALEAELADVKAGRNIAQEAADLLQVEMGELVTTVEKLKAGAKPPPSPLDAQKKPAAK